MSKPKIASVLSLVVMLFAIAFTTAASARDDLTTNEYYGGRNCRRVRVCNASGYCGWRTVCRINRAVEADVSFNAFDNNDDNEEGTENTGEALERQDVTAQ